MGNWGIWQILVVLAIVLLVFGTSRVRNLGGDLGTAIKGFRKAMRDDSGSKPEQGKADRDEDRPGDGDNGPSAPTG